MLGEYLWDVTQSGDLLVNFSFAGHVGDEFTLSSYILSGASLTDVSFAQSSAPCSLVDAGAALNGSFTMAPVPLSETCTLLLSGLGLMGALLRRCKAA